MPRDKATAAHSGFGFVEFKSVLDTEYALKIMTGVRLYGSPIRLSRGASEKSKADIGANLYVGGLSPEVDEAALGGTFSAFGALARPVNVARNPETGEPRGFGFVSFDSFEAADRAIAEMDGQFLCGAQIRVQYAFKKDGAPGERHGSYAERLLAAQRPTGLQPNTMFAASEGGVVSSGAPLPAAPPAAPAPAPGGAQATGANSAPLGMPPTIRGLPSVPAAPAFPGLPQVPPTAGPTPMVMGRMPPPPQHPGMRGPPPSMRGPPLGMRAPHPGMFPNQPGMHGGGMPPQFPGPRGPGFQGPGQRGPPPPGRGMYRGPPPGPRR
ncbi:spliceosomal protein on the X [Thecamonas trahens ATCC 50062]|uniref:Spliceosomal protein on the X n=1 Tax=Thecamonas trahens ATCC 50062 TaxID=461836 RepID=A0A0L0D7P5_THETB|nr:spliceosomal protein on the X [Thecamonas trahens ATCC 50062]KNC47328.1 spliceosomal protein on the X [Thecamonas trahens ATCC 50062]|eukprot:XP_013759666.1 spliceosomal protein on the X [Thecamonas trahens ATCC 50062]